MTCQCGTCRPCQRRRAQAKYEQTEKGRATWRRYRVSAKGQALIRRMNRKRIFVGETYHGRVDTEQRAEQINAHIKERVSAFKQRQQNRKEAEGAASD